MALNSSKQTNLILEHGTSEGPDSCKYKVQFVQLFVAVRGRVLWNEQSFQQITQHLDHRDVHDGCDLLEPEILS